MAKSRPLVRLPSLCARWQAAQIPVFQDYRCPYPSVRCLLTEATVSYGVKLGNAQLLLGGALNVALSLRIAWTGERDRLRRVGLPPSWPLCDTGCRWMRHDHRSRHLCSGFEEYGAWRGVGIGSINEKDNFVPSWDKRWCGRKWSDHLRSCIGSAYTTRARSSHLTHLGVFLFIPGKAVTLWRPLCICLFL
jgi:hypothetical protein